MADISIPIGEDTVLVVACPRDLDGIRRLAGQLRVMLRTTHATSLCDAARAAGYRDWLDAQCRLGRRDHV